MKVPRARIDSVTFRGAPMRWYIRHEHGDIIRRKIEAQESILEVESSGTVFEVERAFFKCDVPCPEIEEPVKHSLVRVLGLGRLGLVR
jgi:hypothetical protein